MLGALGPRRQMSISRTADLDPYTILELPSAADYWEIVAAYADLERVGKRRLDRTTKSIPIEEERLRRRQVHRAFWCLVDKSVRFGRGH